MDKRMNGSSLLSSPLWTTSASMTRWRSPDRLHDGSAESVEQTRRGRAATALPSVYRMVARKPSPTLPGANKYRTRPAASPLALSNSGRDRTVIVRAAVAALPSASVTTTAAVTSPTSASVGAVTKATSAESALPPMARKVTASGAASRATKVSGGSPPTATSVPTASNAVDTRLVNSKSAMVMLGLITAVRVTVRVDKSSVPMNCAVIVANSDPPKSWSATRKTASSAAPSLTAKLNADCESSRLSSA